MKAALFAVAFGAFVAVRAADDQDDGSEEQANAQMLFDDASAIDWERYSPARLGMKLNFDELSKEELEKVVNGFIQLGLIEERERDSFRDTLTHPAMRNMIYQVQENWGNTMTKILKDPMFGSFLQRLKGGVDETALGQIVGLEGGIGEAVKKLQEDQEEQEGEEAEEDAEPPTSGPQQQPSK